MKKKLHKTLSFVLALCMVLSLAQITALADSAPTATTNDATNITQTTATLNGTASDNDNPTDVWFEYGLTGSYGASVKASPDTLFPGTGAKEVLASITGLAVGTTYHYRLVVANTDAKNYGPDIAFRTSPTVPDAPTGVTASAGENRAEISFTAPASNGGAEIYYYTVTSSPGSIPASGKSSPIEVKGLTNGTAYTFTVTATNAAGTGTASKASNSVTPKLTQTIKFANPGSQAFGTTPTLSATASSGLPVTFSTTTPEVGSVTSGGELTFYKAGRMTVVANQAGNSIYYAATSVTQSFDVTPVAPGAPTGVSAKAGNGKAVVSFTAPTFTGGISIQQYLVYSASGETVAGGSSSPITVKGLTNGTTYTFTVKAAGGAGLSPASEPSNSVTPGPTTPDAPTIGTATAGNKQASVNWTAPADNGGSDITGYTVYYYETANTTNYGTITSDASATSATISSLKSATNYTFKVLATNTYGNSSYSETVSATTDSTATLSALSTSSGTLCPDFAPGTMSYAVSVPYSVSSLTVTPTVNDSTSSVTVNGTAVTSGAASGEISLITGSNVITIVVKSQDETTNTYTITVARATYQSFGGAGGSSSITVEASAGTGGKISPSGDSYVYWGGSVSYNITPDKGCRISDVTVDGKSVGAVSSYTFKNVTAKHTITAAFEKIVSPFTDVLSSDWFYDCVAYVSEKGLMNGTSSGAFEPQGNMTRAMFVTVLYRLSGNTGSYTNSFNDVKPDAWYATAIAWAAGVGIAGGVGGGSFAPDMAITREQLAVMLYNYAKHAGKDVSVGKDTNILSYTDASSISEYAFAALQWACGAGLIYGDNNACLNPQKYATRAEVAAILARFLKI